MTGPSGCCCVPTCGGRPYAPGGGDSEGVCLEGYQWAQHDAAFQTNATKAFTGKTLVTPPGLVAGVYRFGITYIGEHSANGKICYANVDMDGGDIFAETQAEVPTDNDYEPRPWARTAVLTLTPGVHTFELWIGTSDANDPVTVYETCLSLWRLT